MMFVHTYIHLSSPLTSVQYPEIASFLTETERCHIVELMKTDSQGLATHYHSQFVLQALKDYKTYVLFGILIGYIDKRSLYTQVAFLTFEWASFSVPNHAISLFMPTIINELGFSVANSQLLSIPPYAAGCICVILVGIYSDKH